MAEPGPERLPPAVDLEAAFAALPVKKEALREAFDCLAACSPYPLPFTWEGLDAHISAIQSSISRRLRQVQVLETARPARAAPAPKETQSGLYHYPQQQEEAKAKEKVEAEVEGDEDDIDDGEDKRGEGEENVEEGEVVEEEKVEEEVDDATLYEGEQEDDDEMQLTNEEDQNSKKEPQASGKVEEQNVDQEMVPGKDKDAEEETGKEVHGVGEEEHQAEEEKELPYAGPVAKSAEVSLKEDMTQKQVQRAPASRTNDLMVACASMDANMLVNLICNRVALGEQIPIAMCYAPDVAALVLQVVKLFLSSKKFKLAKNWKNCISLIRCVPAATSKPSTDTIEQAKQMAKDWNEMIYKLVCAGHLESLHAWGLLYFLVSYNIVSEFDTKEIISLFSMVPRHKQEKNTMELCKGLGIVDKITDLIDYLIGKGQHMDVFHLSHVFNLSDKYPLLSLLKGYIETAKQTAMEIRSKSMTSARPKEISNLWVAHHLAKQNITDSSQRDAILVEIETLLGGYAVKKGRCAVRKRLAKECTSNVQTKRKMYKKEKLELHKSQQNLQQDQQRKAQERGHRQISSQQKQQKQGSRMWQNEQQQPKIRPQVVQQKLLNKPRPCTPKLATPLQEAELNNWPEMLVQISSSNPFYPHPQFYHR